LAHSAADLQYTFHHTSNVSLHYLVNIAINNIYEVVQKYVV